MIHLVQIGNGLSRRVAVVEEPRLRCLVEVQTVYELAQESLGSGGRLSELALALARGETLDYDTVYAGHSEWRLLDAHRCAWRTFASVCHGNRPNPSGKRKGPAGDA